MKTRSVFMFGASLLIGIYSQLLFAATQVISNGMLIGANNVEVDGKLYDARFVTGTYNDLFPSLLFDTYDKSFRASEALIDQVILNTPQIQIDVNAGSLNGCGIGFGACWLSTPYYVAGDSTVFTNAALVQDLFPSGFSKTVIRVDSALTFNAVFGNNYYVIWNVSQVPEPEVFMTMLAGIFALSFRLRK